MGFIKQHSIGLIILASIGLPATVCAQKNQVENLKTYDHQRIHFGFLLGSNSANFVLKPSPNIELLDSVLSVEPESSSGFNLGIVSDLRINEHLNLRFQPTLGFAERRINYKIIHDYNKTTTFPVKRVESTFLMFPMGIKYRSSRINNYRLYLMAGVNYALDLASQQDADQSSNPDDVIVKIKKSDFLVEAGVGIDFYLQYFKFSPEFKIAYGLPNLLVADNEIYSRAISKLRSKIFMITLYFE